MEKLLDQILRRIKQGGITVTYPNERIGVYGDKAEAAKLHIRFKTAAVLAATVRNPSLGFGEGFMRGDITFEAGFFEELMSVMGANKQAMSRWFNLPVVRQLLNASNVKSRQKSNISHHYDIGNDFYKLWLDDSMTYSCAYFRTPQDSLEDAQDQKRRHILRKLKLEQGMSLLDIGSGWGSLLIMAARDYGVSGLGVTLSEEQLKHSRQAARTAGVDHLVKFELTNFQDLPATGRQFDRVVSVGMFEHVGPAGMSAYFDVVARLLKPGGVTLLHTISTTDAHGGNDAWMDKYIFPGGYIPAVREIIDRVPRFDLRPIDYESLRLHYALTLDEWLRRYELVADQVKAERGDEFYRMWQMYLATCAGNFRSGGLDLSQFVFVKGLNNNLPLTREGLYK
jgi:cyclopropane-fatty-acyl-phospholipid synthase